MRNLISSSALRLCDWLFDNSDIQFAYVDKALAFAFRAEKRKVTQFCVFIDPGSRFTSTSGTQYPFKPSTAHRNPCAFFGAVFPCSVRHRAHISSIHVQCNTDIDFRRPSYWGIGNGDFVQDKICSAKPGHHLHRLRKGDNAPAAFRAAQWHNIQHRLLLPAVCVLGRLYSESAVVADARSRQ